MYFELLSSAFDLSPGMSVKYCYQHACTILECLPARYTSKTIYPNFVKLSVLVACGRRWVLLSGVAICHVFPVLWMTSSLHLVAKRRRREKDVRYD